MQALPISAVIATRDRPEKLAGLFRTLRLQGRAVAEVVVVDASTDDRTRALCEGAEAPSGTRWFRARQPGAASQRNEGVALSSQPFVLFVDDDILLEPGSLGALWEAMCRDAGLGGVNAMITNQVYHAPGRISRLLYGWMHRGPVGDYSGKCVGPGINFLPKDTGDRRDISPVDWLNLGLTLYRREALPDPPFHPHFIGYSMGEDLALSLVVARKWRLANVPAARVFHDTGSGRRSLGAARGAAMELVNRHFIMTEIRGMRRPGDYGKLAAWELFSIASTLRSPGGWARLPAVLAGKVRGIVEILGAGCGVRGARF